MLNTVFDFCILAFLITQEDAAADKCMVQVAERRLHIGVHNGWGYIDTPQIVMLDAETLTRGGTRGSKRKPRKGSVSGSR